MGITADAAAPVIDFEKIPLKYSVVVRFELKWKAEGAAFKTGKNNHIYFDIERSTGSDFKKELVKTGLSGHLRRKWNGEDGKSASRGRIKCNSSSENDR